MTYSQDYHRYLKVPFIISRPNLFYTKPNKTIQAEKADHTHVDPKFKVWLQEIGIKEIHIESFYTAPNDKIKVHLDFPMLFDNHVKINLTWGSNDSVMRWWKVKNKKKINYGQSVNYFPLSKNILTTDESNCDMQYEQVINKPSLVNVGCFHSTYNPSNEGRWTLCIVPLINKKVIKWNDAIEIFKEVII